MELRFVDGWDMWWKVSERAWVVGTHGSEIRGSITWSVAENRTKVCGWMGYTVEDLRTSLGHGDAWIGVPVQCYMECNSMPC